jgi:hypothetical protein
LALFDRIRRRFFSLVWNESDSERANFRFVLRYSISLNAFFGAGTVDLVDDPARLSRYEAAWGSRGPRMHRAMGIDNMFYSETFVKG